MPHYRVCGPKCISFLQNVYSIFIAYFERSGIHGFAYLAFQHLHIIEKLFWLCLVTLAFSATVILNMKSIHRYRTENTVVSIERDYHYWNTTLASVTSCPTENRIDKTLFNEYCNQNGISGQDKVEFYEFIESMANATYDSFHLIKDHDSIKKLKIQPKDYMTLIYNLTRDARIKSSSTVPYIKAYRRQEYIRSEQVLTEQGICYSTNNYLLANLSAKYLITGIYSDPLKYKHNRTVHNVLTGNFFDGDQTYFFVGFDNYYMTYIHSPYDVFNIAKSKLGQKGSIEVTTYSQEIVADKHFQWQTSISQRRCRYNSESNLTHYEIYSRGLCLRECRLNLVYKQCGCIPHFYPNRIANPKPVCSYKVLKECVAPQRDIFLELQFDDSNGRTVQIDCNCMHNCVGFTVLNIRSDLLVDGNQLLETGGTILTVREFPVVRYKRKVLYSLTNLWVSIGATASFFTGISVLGVVEIIYFFTLRLFWHLLGRRIVVPENQVANEN